MSNDDHVNRDVSWMPGPAQDAIRFKRERDQARAERHRLRDELEGARRYVAERRRLADTRAESLDMRYEQGRASAYEDVMERLDIALADVEGDDGNDH